MNLPWFLRVGVAVLIGMVLSEGGGSACRAGAEKAGKAAPVPAAVQAQGLELRVGPPTWFTDGRGVRLPRVEVVATNGTPWSFWVMSRSRYETEIWYETRPGPGSPWRRSTEFACGTGARLQEILPGGTFVAEKSFWLTNDWGSEVRLQMRALGPVPPRRQPGMRVRLDLGRAVQLTSGPVRLPARPPSVATPVR